MALKALMALARIKSAAFSATISVTASVLADGTCGMTACVHHAQALHAAHLEGSTAFVSTANGACALSGRLKAQKT